MSLRFMLFPFLEFVLPNVNQTLGYLASSNLDVIRRFQVPLMKTYKIIRFVVPMVWC